MKNRKNTFKGLILLAVISLASCGVTKDAGTTDLIEIANPVKFTIVKNGQIYVTSDDNIEHGIVVIDSEVSWSALKMKMNKPNQVIKDETVDFSREMIVGYFDKVRPSGGYSVEIVSITETAEEIVVLYKLSNPTSDAIDIRTQPFTLVSIPRTTKTVRIEPIG